jgi:4-amino-4-deoxychorismate lyase
MFLLNGESRHLVDVSDRGFQYGDGLFETLEVLQGTALFLDRHLQRLTEGCQRLLLPPPDWQLLQQEAQQLTANTEHGVLKIIMTRGSGGRGYRQPEPIVPTRLLSLHPYPQYPTSLQSHGIVTRFCDQLLSINPSLAGIKHLNRLEQVLARAEWRDDAIQEGLMLDNNGHVIEGTMSNLFIVKNAVLYTPALTQSGIAGIVRQLVLAFANQLALPISIQNLSKDQLLQADEVFVTNSVIGIWPVKQIAQHSFQVGEWTQRLQVMLNQARLIEVENHD